MSTPKITAQEKLALRNSARAELERLETCLSDDDTVQLLDSFKNEFNICETVYKIILIKHQNCKKRNISNFPKIDMRQVPHVFNFAGYNFDKNLLNNLFGVHSNNGSSVKKLRDAVTHGIDAKAVEEIENRKDELFGYMETFLTTIRDFDVAA